MGERNGVPIEVERELEEVRRQIAEYDIGDRPQSPPARLFERERELMAGAWEAARAALAGNPSAADVIPTVGTGTEVAGPDPMAGLEWGTIYRRRHDYGTGRVCVSIREGGDVALMVVEADGRSAGVEFTLPTAAGGRSPRTRAALVALARAIAEDNAADPFPVWGQTRDGATVVAELPS